MTTTQPSFMLRSALASPIPKRFRAEGNLHYLVKISIEAGREFTLDDVQMVVYVLDPSFREGQYRVSADRSRSFAIEIWTYGFFDAKAKIILKDESVITINGEVRWEVPIPSSSLSSGW